VDDHAEAYEVAFSYRDVPTEVDTLVGWHRRHAAVPLGRVLELAAGPADHALEFARRGIVATALDLNPSMCHRAEQRARSAQLPLAVVCADMTDFTLDGSYDLALLMLAQRSIC
jgi:ubiquinone/menaquinone biosynthesis C-methylase UbiE